MSGDALGSADQELVRSGEATGQEVRSLILAAGPGRDDGHDGVVVVSGRRIDGLDLCNVTVAADVVFEDCQFTGRTSMERLRAASVTFRGCRFENGLGMTAAQFVGDLDIVGGWVGLSDRADEAALDLRDVSVTAAATIHPGECAGELRMDRASFAESLTVAGRFVGIRGPDVQTGSLRLVGVWCQGDLRLYRANATTGCTLTGLCVTGDMSLNALSTSVLLVDSAAVDGGIDLDSAEVRGHALLDDVAAGLGGAVLGAVRLGRATIQGTLKVSQCVLGAPLHLTSTTVGGDTWLLRSVFTGSAIHPAVAADRAALAGGVKIEDCRAELGVSLASAEIAGDLALGLDVTGRRILHRPGLDLTGRESTARSSTRAVGWRVAWRCPGLRSTTTSSSVSRPGSKRLSPSSASNSLRST